MYKSEHIKEYSVLIDSKDRNYQVYPDPFSYIVNFNPVTATREYETPAPVINSGFKNVKYIRLEQIILPLYNRIWDVNVDGKSRTQVMTPKPLTDNLYTVLSLGSEFVDENYYSTNDVLSTSFSTIYFDKNINSTHYIGRTSNGTKSFEPRVLPNLHKLQINFMDPYGEPLRCTHLNPRIKSSLCCTCGDPEGDDYTDCYRHNLTHPLNPIFQHHLHFKIGIVESYIR